MARPQGTAGWAAQYLRWEGRGVRHDLMVLWPCVTMDIMSVRCFKKVSPTALKCLKNDWSKRMKRGWNIPDEALSIAC